MAHWEARVEFVLSAVEPLFLSLTVEALQGKMCQNSLPSGGGRSLGVKISGGNGRPLPIMKLCSRLFVLYCRNYPKDDKFRYFIPILRTLGAA